ncbi:MAG TPA: hypothetical protein VN643_11950 [Pyrinomonadaceae bacterium]|nr:hypothetical protein [Pyrinomonadaceae bacterium]
MRALDGRSFNAVGCGEAFRVFNVVTLQAGKRLGRRASREISSDQGGGRGIGILPMVATAHERDARATRFQRKESKPIFR